jgi:hypothetical protein
MRRLLPILLLICSLQSLQAGETVIRELFDQEKIFLGAVPTKPAFLIDVDTKVTKRGLSFQLNDFGFNMDMSSKDWQGVRQTLPGKLPFVSTTKQFSAKAPEDALTGLYLGMRFYENFLQREADKDPSKKEAFQKQYNAAQLIKDAAFYQIMKIAQVKN